MTHERVLESVKVSGGGPGFGARYSANPLIRYSAQLLCCYAAFLLSCQHRSGAAAAAGGCALARGTAKWAAQLQSYVNLPDTTLPQHPERVAWPQLSSDAGNADAEPTERLHLILCGAV